jgi:hypothetical protein
MMRCKEIIENYEDFFLSLEEDRALFYTGIYKNLSQIVAFVVFRSGAHVYLPGSECGVATNCCYEIYFLVLTSSGKVNVNLEPPSVYESLLRISWFWEID